jgi:transposase
MEAYSQKMREVVLESYAQGLKTNVIAKQLKVHPSWVRRVKQRWQELRLRNAIKQRHGPAAKLTEADRSELAELVKKTPDATLEQLHAQFNKPVSISTVTRALNDMKLTFKKKSIHASEQDRPDVKIKREEWEQCMPGLDLDKLVFFDEIGVNTKMVRLHGRCHRSQRLVDFAPAGHYSNSTLLSGMRLNGIVAPMLIDGPVNTETFAGYIEECMVPALEPGDILITDNLPAHKSERVRLAVEAAGCILVYLPPYSPDLNPIENMWSVTLSDCEGYFTHCGYSDSPT